MQTIENTVEKCIVRLNDLCSSMKENKGINKVKQILLRYFDMFFLFYHLILGFYICCNVISGSTVTDVYCYFVISLVMSVVLLQLIKVMNFSEHKLHFFAVEILLTIFFISSIDYYTYTAKTFLALLIAIISIYIICIDKFYYVIPLISCAIEFIVPEYLFSYFQFVAFVMLLKKGKDIEKINLIRKIFVTSYILQILAGIANYFVFDAQQSLVNIHFFDGAVRIRANIIFVIFSSCVVYIYHSVKTDRQIAMYAYMMPFILIPIASMFMQETHVFAFALYLMGIVGLFFAKKESFTEKFKVIRKHIFAIMALTFFIKLIYYLDVNLINEDPFTISVYYFDYFHFGFTQRTFIGTLFYLLFGYHISEDKFYILVTIFYFLFFVALFSLLCVLYKSYKKSSYYDSIGVAEILFFMYLTSAPFLSYVYPELVYRIDLYNMFIAFVCIYLIWKNKYMLAVPVLCTIALLCHQVFVFIIFPIVFIALTYRVFIDHEGHFKRNLFIFIITLVSIAGLFLYLQLFSHMFTAISSDEAIQVIYDRSDKFFAGNKYFDGDLGIISKVIFADLNTHVDAWQSRITSVQIFGTIKLVLCSIPLIAVYFYAFFKSAKMEENKFQKLVYRVMPFSILAFLPTYILETDYGRWNQHLIAAFMISLIVLTILQKPSKKWYRDLSRKKIWCVLCLVYLIMVSMPLFTRAV